MDKQNMVYIHNGILFSHKRKKVLMKFENIMLSEKNRYKRPYDPIYIKYPE